MIKNTQKTLIWDLSGTLVNISNVGINTYQESSYSLLLYLWGGKKEASWYDSKALEILNTFGAQEGPEDMLIRFPNGTLVPLINCEWLAGKVSSLEITQKALEALAATTLLPQEKNTLKDMFITAFDPYTLANCTVPIASATKLFTLFAHQVPYQYVLSNWDKESFSVLYKESQTQDIFSLLPRERIVISADAGELKPHPGIYEYFLRKYQVTPQECIFIDNQAENLAIAQDFGIQTILFTDDFEEVYLQISSKIK